VAEIEKSWKSYTCFSADWKKKNKKPTSSFSAVISLVMTESASIFQLSPKTLFFGKQMDPGKTPERYVSNYFHSSSLHCSHTVGW